MNKKYVVIPVVLMTPQELTENVLTMRKRIEDLEDQVSQLREILIEMTEQDLAEYERQLEQMQKGEDND